MILLTGFLHREDFKDVLFRVMSNKTQPDDCQHIKEIINFNVYLVQLYLDDICQELFSHLSGGQTWSTEVTTKGQLKDFILDVAPYRDERYEELAAKYRKFPEDFFRSSPFYAKMYCTGTRERPVYLGHSRMKRFRRIAEKGARQIISVIFNQVKKRADELAAERAAKLGIPKDRLITSPEEQVLEFAHAERRFLKEIRKGLYYPDRETVLSSCIHDVAGIKAIVEDRDMGRFEAYFMESPRFTVVEKETHKGAYNATNFIVEYRLDKKRLLEKPPDSRIEFVLAARGMVKERIIEDYRSFIEDAEETVLIEVIASTYREMLESELGRCMHEERILGQREKIQYRSIVARNVRYMMEFLFLFAQSGKESFQEMPIKLWERTLPDSYDHAVRMLWDIPTIPIL